MAAIGSCPVEVTDFLLQLWGSGGMNILQKDEYMREFLGSLRNASCLGNEAEFSEEITHSELLSQL